MNLVALAIVGVTFILACGSIVAAGYIWWVAAGDLRVNHSEQRRQLRWAVLVAMFGLVVAVLAAWAVLRITFPQLDIPRLPDWTLFLTVVLCNIPFLMVINLARTWARWRREAVDETDRSAAAWSGPDAR